MRLLSSTSRDQWHPRSAPVPFGTYELFSFVTGQGRFRTGDRTWPIVPGRLYLAAPGQTPEVLAHPDDPSPSFVHLTFTVEPDDPAVPVLADPGFRGVFPVLLGPSGRLFLEEASARFRPQAAPARTRAFDLRLEALLLDLAESEPGLDSGPSNFLVEQALGLLQSHVFQQVTLGAVCERLRITEEYLIRLFRRHLGVTPMRYLNRLKMDAGASLLRSSSLSVKEISWKLGFSSQYHFSRSFKVYAGKTPTDYRSEPLRVLSP